MSRVTPPLPVRPALPLTLFLFVGLWSSTALWLNRWIDVQCGLVEVGQAALESPWTLLIVCAALVSLLVFGMRISQLRIAVLLFAVGVMGGWVLGWGSTVALARMAESIGVLPDTGVDLVAVDDATTTRTSTVQTARIVEGPGRGALIQLTYLNEVKELELGQHARVFDMVLPLTRTASSRMLYARRIIGRCTISRHEEAGYRGVTGPIHRFRANLTSQIETSSEHGSLTRAILLGDRRGIGSDLKEAFARTGLSHVLAVSGSHFAVLVACLLWMGRKAGLDRRILSIGVLVLCICYVVLTGMPPSAIRALGMLMLSSLGIWVLRRGSPLNALACTGTACLVVMPFWSISLGFCLSVLAVAGIGLFARYGSWVLGALFDFLPRRLTSDGALTLTALMVTMPLTSVQFGYLSVVSPLANIAVAPLMMTTLTISFLGVVTTLFNEAVAQNVFDLCALINRVVEYLVIRLSALKWATVPTRGGPWMTTAIATGAALLWWFWPCPARPFLRRAGRTFITIVTLVIAAVCLASQLVGPTTTPRVVILDVGQGDAAVLASGTNALLIDAGPDPASLLSQLQRQSISTIDALIVTHDHDDHLAGARALKNRFGVQALYHAQSAHDSADIAELASTLGVEARPLVVGDRMLWRGFVLEVIGPLSTAGDLSHNESSLVLVVTSQRGGDHAWYRRIKPWKPSASLQTDSVLIGGDAEALHVRQALSSSTLRTTKVGVLKLGHHGSAGSVDTALLEMTRPEAVVISVGTQNSYRHPSAQALEVCERFVGRVLRTDRNGPITIGLIQVDVAQ